MFITLCIKKGHQRVSCEQLSEPKCNYNDNYQPFFVSKLTTGNNYRIMCYKGTYVVNRVQQKQDKLLKKRKRRYFKIEKN